MDKQKIRRLLIGDLSIKRLIRSFVFICVAIYAFLLIYAYFFSERMIFLPGKSTYQDGPDIIKIETKDGMHISAWYLPNTDAELTILYSHGNAEDIGAIRPYLEMLRDEGFSVLAYDYRGYGTSDGKPSERGVCQDVEAAYEYLLTQLNTAPNRIIAMGRSVGGAVALHLACRKQVSGLVLESSFVTAFRVVTHIPLLPFDRFRNIDKIKQIRCPILVIHGKDDRIIPFWHGERLFREANEPKLHLWVAGAGHNDLVWVAGSRYWDVIGQFKNIVRSN